MHGAIADIGTLAGRSSAACPFAVLEGPGVVDRDHVSVGEAGLADGGHPAILLIHILHTYQHDCG